MKVKVNAFGFVTLVAIVWASAAQGAAIPDAVLQKISPFLQKQRFAKSATTSAFVMLKQQANLAGAQMLLNKNDRGQFVYDKLRNKAAETQGPLLAWLKANRIKHQRFYIANMIVVFNVDFATLAEIAGRDDTQALVANPIVKALPKVYNSESELVNVEPEGIGPNISAIGADRVWQELNIKGENIIVAGQDTGYDWEHPALKANYRGWDGESTAHNYSWHDSIKEPLGNGNNRCGYNSAEPCDDNGHGTHTMGTVAGDDGNANQVGVAPGAKWIGCRNMDAGIGRPSSYIECFEWFLAPYPRDGDPLTDGDTDQSPHVINNSWGCPPSEGCQDAEILPVLQSLYAAGIMVVASAGNEGSSCKTIQDPPAMHSDETFSVGAHNHRSGKIASFSSRGPSRYDGQVGPDITAPGVGIRSAIPGGGYSGSFSGTSMAGPHVAGQVALIWSADASLVGNIAATADLIRQTATPTTSTQTCGGVSGQSIPNNTFGWGRINAYESVKARIGG